MRCRAFGRRRARASIVALLVSLAFDASADAQSAPSLVDPYELPDAPRPPTLPELTHPGIELTGESTFGVLRPDVDPATGRTPADVGGYVQRFSFEWPVALRRYFVGATYEFAAAKPPASGGFEAIAGNLDV